MYHPAAIPDRFTYLNQTVSFTATASDAESSVQTLSFSLTGSPAGAAIESGSGLFHWLVANVAVPGTHSVTVRESDNGTPPLSDARTFNVIVRRLPQRAAVLFGNEIQFTWPPAESGWRLQAQTNSLAAGLGANWVDVPGSSVTNQLALPISAASGAVFFRLVYP